MILTGVKLTEIGKALFGQTWPSTMSTRLRCHRVTIFTWIKNGPPADTRAQLVQLIDDKLVELANLKAELEEDMQDGPT